MYYNNQLYNNNPLYSNNQFYSNARNGIKGRFVSSEEEVRAAQVDFDGSYTYFPCPAQRVIYAKSIDLNGLPVIQAYKLNNAQENLAKQNENLTKQIEGLYNQLEGLIKRVDNLEQVLK